MLQPEFSHRLLGLPICRGLVRAMGGQVEVFDAAPGARFVVRLPVAELKLPAGHDPSAL